MVGVGGCPCARRERERQRRREEVGWVWVVVVVAGLCRRSFVELRRGGTVGLGVSLRSSPRVRRVPPESESGLQRGGGAALPCLVLTCPRSCGWKESVWCVVAWRECGCRARVRGGGKVRGAAARGAGQLAARTHAVLPRVCRGEKKCTRAERGGAFSRSRGRTEAAERGAPRRRKGGGALFGCGRIVWCCVVGVCGF